MELMKTLKEKYDDPKSQFFFSTVITAVLSHHLSWTASLGKGDQRKRGREGNSCLPLKRRSVNKQLKSIHGAKGKLAKVTSILILGKDTKLVRDLLYVLSYFVRAKPCLYCSSLPAQEEPKELEHGGGLEEGMNEEVQDKRQELEENSAKEGNGSGGEDESERVLREDKGEKEVKTEYETEQQRQDTRRETEHPNTEVLERTEMSTSPERAGGDNPLVQGFSSPPVVPNPTISHPSRRKSSDAPGSKHIRLEWVYLRCGFFL